MRSSPHRRRRVRLAAPRRRRRGRARRACAAARCWRCCSAPLCRAGAAAARPRHPRPVRRHAEHHHRPDAPASRQQTPLFVQRFRNLSARARRGALAGADSVGQRRLQLRVGPATSTPSCASSRASGSGFAERAQTLGRGTLHRSASRTRTSTSTPSRATRSSNIALRRSRRFRRRTSTQLPPERPGDLRRRRAAHAARPALQLRPVLPHRRLRPHRHHRRQPGAVDQPRAHERPAPSPRSTEPATAAPATSRRSLSTNPGRARRRRPAGLRRRLSAARTDSFNESAIGTGDLFLRVKWHFADTELRRLRRRRGAHPADRQRRRLPRLPRSDVHAVADRLEDLRPRLAAPQPRLLLPQRPGRQPGAVDRRRRRAHHRLADAGGRLPRLPRRQARRHQRRRRPVGRRLQGQPLGRPGARRQLPVPGQHATACAPTSSTPGRSSTRSERARSPSRWHGRRPVGGRSATDHVRRFSLRDGRRRGAATG